MNLRALFCELRSVEDTVERARLIDERLADDETSRQRLLELFAAAQLPAINPLDRMGQALGATVGFPESGETDWHAVDSEPDRYLPPYRLIEQIGEGGNGGGVYGLAATAHPTHGGRETHQARDGLQADHRAF